MFHAMLYVEHFRAKLLPEAVKQICSISFALFDLQLHGIQAVCG